ncbi:hypothetical protein HanXRQr2_Chr17g0801481 [Helianthus annuus]|uniref:Uncharacterized protein n=1 Tax=Helianthus annuus TaxID=4232 RepID=A0A251RQ00_HELAN|nr:hypothetical protein HanXRQr2_Chr17g0801481 [Helianthus annuus]KAJ0433337.1 hypothetical protein HanIR_Chr17g0869151 [Helianthus annuus]KAJ0813052.1 hypothetical protein HanPSC8_Chr17g0769061 [Helianthus annuus]
MWVRPCSQHEILEVFNRQIGFSSPKKFSHRISSSKVLEYTERTRAFVKLQTAGGTWLASRIEGRVVFTTNVREISKLTSLVPSFVISTTLIPLF